jgi:hypothetical protein
LCLTWTIVCTCTPYHCFLEISSRYIYSYIFLYEYNCGQYSYTSIVVAKFKWSNIRCTQHFLYFESHSKSLKHLHIIVCFSVLSISSAFTISTFFINEWMYLDEISRKQCTNVKKKSLRYILWVVVILFLRAKVIPVNP